MNPSIMVSFIIKIPYVLVFFMSFPFQKKLSMIFIIDFNDLGPSIKCVYLL
jgi:hypothetical protein